MIISPSTQGKEKKENQAVIDINQHLCNGSPSTVDHSRFMAILQLLGDIRVKVGVGGRVG